MCGCLPMLITLGIFAAFQSVFAIKAVEKTTGGKAFLAWLITVAAFFLLNQAFGAVWDGLISGLSRAS
jgi:hypothetical protein